MGGTVIKTRAQVILEQGREEGEAITLAGLIRKGVITLMHDFARWVNHSG